MFSDRESPKRCSWCGDALPPERQPEPGDPHTHAFRYCSNYCAREARLDAKRRWFRKHYAKNNPRSRSHEERARQREQEREKRAREKAAAPYVVTKGDFVAVCYRSGAWAVRRAAQVGLDGTVRSVATREQWAMSRLRRRPSTEMTLGHPSCLVVLVRPLLRQYAQCEALDALTKADERRVTADELAELTGGGDRCETECDSKDAIRRMLCVRVSGQG